MARKRELESFVARIWLEREQNGDPLWRGHIRHVQSEQEAYFQDLDGINAFLERVSGMTGPGKVRRPEAGNAAVPNTNADTK